MRGIRFLPRPKRIPRSFFSSLFSQPACFCASCVYSLTGCLCDVIVFDPVVRTLYQEPAIFGSSVHKRNSWDIEQLLAIDSLFIPENNSDFPDVPNWSNQELRRRIERIRAPAIISHVSAARIFGLPLPYRVAADPRLHVTVSRSRARSHQSGIYSHLGDLLPTEIVVSNSLHLTHPARIVADLAGLLNLSELSVLLDAAQAPHINPLFEDSVGDKGSETTQSVYTRLFYNMANAQSESEFVKILLRRRRFPGRTNVVRLVQLRKQNLLPFCDIPWQSFVAATITSHFNTSTVLLSPDQIAIPKHNVIVVQPWHFSDDRETSMTIASTITALRSFGWCADSFSYRDLLSVDSLLNLYTRLRNRSEFAHMRLYPSQPRE